MKFIIEGAGGTYTFLITPNMLLLIAALFVILAIAKWHYAQKRRELDFKQWEKIHDDYRTGETDNFMKKVEKNDDHEERTYN